MKSRFLSSSADDTLDVGRRLGLRLKEGDLVAVSGPLGAGKTVFIRGVCIGLGFTGLVSSPSFVIVNRYPARFPIYHVDLYRIASPQDLVTIGYEELFYPDGVCLVEWPEKAEKLLPEQRMDIHIEITGENTRTILVFRPGRAEDPPS